MKHPVVLDACTIINLLRIDEDEFLFRLLCSLRLYVADLVNQEIMKNIFHNELSEEQRTYISDVLPQLQSKWNSFNQTMDLIDTDFYEKNHSCPEKFYHSVSCLGPSPSGTLVVRSV